MKEDTFRDLPVIHARTRKEWRDWLHQHHETIPRVWLVQYNKKSRETGVPYADAVEEALCYGWIDGVKYKRDEGSSYQYFTHRKPKSTWSQSNRDRVERLTTAGLMQPAGQAMVNLAKEKGTWNVPKK